MVTRVVTSPSNSLVKATMRLRNRRERNRTGLFLVEGFREVRRAIEAGVAIERLWFAPELYLGASEAELVERAASAGADAVEASANAFTRMAYRDRPEGLLAVCRQFDTSLANIRQTALVLVVESIEKPGNLGTMIRTATAAGADAVIAADPTTDVFNPNVVRASIGTLFSVPVAVASTDETIGWLRSKGVRICAASPDAHVALWATDLGGAVALVVGAEQYGLSASWLQAADVAVQIPMPGTAIDSLNAASSAAILLFEAVRQRSL